MQLIFSSLVALSIFSTDSLQPAVKTPQIEQRITTIRESLKKPVPLLTLPNETLDARAQMAQQIVAGSAELGNLLFDPASKQPTLNEVFAVYPARPSDINNIPECLDGNCYRVEIYNYASNTSIIAFAHLIQAKIVRMGMMQQTQPDIPSHLKDLAMHIAVSSPEIVTALGYTPQTGQALMSDTKTALNRTRCERSKHLCVAPTFVQGEKALWAIVDLTELRLAGFRWTTVGEPGPAPTEKRIQNAEITECYCVKTNQIERNDWKYNYIITSSDGIRISEVEYQGQRLLNSAKLVDWHVSYSNTDGFGYSDAVGCPTFSSSAVVAVAKPEFADIIENGVVTGFSMIQNYVSEGWPTPCNYNYEQRFEFYNDGRFRMAVGSLGRGCGNNGTYRPVLRFAFADHRQFEEWSGTEWKSWAKEGWQQQIASTPFTSEGFQYRIVRPGLTDIALKANVGAERDGGRGDKALVYITRKHPQIDEGESDMVTIGPCCNTDYRQGPEKFIEPNPETIDGSDELVLWYVPEMKNDDRKGQEYCWAESLIQDGIIHYKVYPCYGGPVFVPVK